MIEGLAARAIRSSRALAGACSRGPNERRRTGFEEVDDTAVRNAIEAALRCRFRPAATTPALVLSDG